MKTTPSKRLTLELSHPRLLQSSPSFKLLSFDNHSHHRTESHQLDLNTALLPAELKMYEWRVKTELPVVKVTDFQVGQSNTDKTSITVEVEVYPFCLADLKDLPLFKILYLLKQAIIGCQRLYSKVGGFLLTPKMVVLNQSNKCKVWVNQNFASNTPCKVMDSQIEFLQTIYRQFQEKTHKSKSSSSFFSDLKKLETFCQALSFIENYARDNKISIPSSLKISSNEKINDKFGHSFDPSLTMTKVPNFISSMSMSPKSKNHIMAHINSSGLIQENWLDSKLKKIEMKASGDTAADILASNSNSVANEENLVDSLMFNQQEVNANYSLNNIQQKKSLFTRKYSGRDQSYNIHCTTPNLAARNWEEAHHFSSNDHQFLGEEKDDEEEETDPEKLKTLFSTNNWKMTLKGLFVHQQPLRKSFHNGKEARKTQFSNNHLPLLGGLGKNMIESNINDEHDN